MYYLCVSDPDVQQKVQRYLTCSAEDIEILRDAISQKDLTGVEEIIVKCTGSPRLPRHRQRSDPDERPIVTGTPKMLRRMDGPENVNGSAHQVSNMATMGVYHENGIDNSDSKDSNKRQDRGFETFVMTGDMIIRTTSSHAKGGEIGRKSSMEKRRRSGGSDSSVGSGGTNKQDSDRRSPHSSPQKKKSDKARSRIPKPASMQASPKHSPKQSPVRVPPVRVSPKSSPGENTHPKVIFHISTDSENTDSELLSDQTPEIENVESVNNNLITDNAMTMTCQSPTQISDISGQAQVRAVEMQREAQQNELLYVAPSYAPTYSAVSPELDIPPDDISSEDDMYKNMDTLINLDDLPPPPDELLHDYVEKPEEFPRDEEVPLPPPVSFEPIKRLGQSQIPVYCPPYVPDVNNPIEPIYQNTGYNRAVSSSIQYPVGMEDDVIAKNKDLFSHIPVPSSHSSATSSYSPVSSSHIPISASCTANKRNIVVSQSSEKISYHQVGTKTTTAGVRTSKSHENYLESNDNGVTMVDIDFEDNMASSVDVLNYREQSDTSLEKLQETSRSLDNSPERKYDKHSERMIPTFINLEEPRSITRLKDGGRVRDVAMRQVLEEQAEVCLLRDGDRVPNGNYSPHLAMHNGQNHHYPIYHNGQMGILEEGESPTHVSGGAGDHHQGHSTDHTHQGAPGGTGIAQGAGVYAQSRGEGAGHHASHMQYVEPEVHIHQMPLPKHAMPTTSHVSDAAAAVEQTLQYGIDAEKEAPPSTSPQHSAKKRSPKHVDFSKQQSTSSSSSPESGPSSPDGDSDTDSVYHQPMKDVDRPSAIRLAKRLFNMEGFKKTDISKHLCKK